MCVVGVLRGRSSPGAAAPRGAPSRPARHHVRRLLRVDAARVGAAPAGARSSLVGTLPAGRPVLHEVLGGASSSPANVGNGKAFRNAGNMRYVGRRARERMAGVAAVSTKF